MLGASRRARSCRPALRHEADQRVQPGTQRGGDGSGHRIESPSTGRAIGGVTDLASCWMRSVSPPAHIGSVSARWCGSASALTGRGAAARRATGRSPRRSRPARPADRPPDRASRLGGPHRMVKRLNQIGGQPAGHRQHGSRSPATPGRCPRRGRHTRRATCRSTRAYAPSRSRVGRGLRTGDVVGAGRHRSPSAAATR